MKGRKALTKLIAAFLLLMLSLTLAAAGTYAWFTLSTAPEIGGMQLSIGGSNTIRIAPDGFSPSRAVGGGGVFRARRDFRARFDVRPSGIRREIPCFSDQRDL